MGTVRAGNQPGLFTVLSVFDVQVGVMNESWRAQRVVRNIARAVERARVPGVREPRAR